MMEQQFIASLKIFLEALEGERRKELTSLKPTVATSQGGKRFVRVYERYKTGTRQALCFVERSTGLVWKAASWKAPALNFPRGSIYKGSPE
jgi:hypothetical protein